MAGKNISLTNAEWSVMESLWESAPKTVMQVAAYLRERVGWAKSTSITVLGRMEKKGLVTSASGGKAKLYYPNVDREDAVTQETKSFIDRVYGGSVGIMMNAMVNRNELTRDDIKEFFEILGKAGEDEG